MADGKATEGESVIAAANFSAGQITSFDSFDIPNEASVELTNTFLRQDKLSRRSGHTLITPAKPNSNKVLGTASVQLFDGSTKQLRFDRSKVYLRSAVWTEITGAGLAGGDNDRFTVLYSNDETFFANNGANVLQKINFGASTYAAAGNAPRYKYWCSFYNRIVGANLAGPVANPILVGWSGDTNFSQWDPALDFSAGYNPLIETQSDLSDEVTGLFAFANIMLVLRQQSIWAATKQPSATSPFAFYTAVPGIGCDAPFTAVQVPNGIIWYDRRTNVVWQYTVGADAPVNISQTIDIELGNSIEDQAKCFANYDAYNKLYQLAAPISSSILVKVWNYSLVTGAWWVETVDKLSSIDNLSIGTASTTIDDLRGTISSLVGTIDSLSPSVVRPTRFLGFTSGEIMTKDDGNDMDDTASYTTTIKSKTFNVPDNVVNITKLELDVLIRKPGTMSVSFSKDDGSTWTTYKTLTTSTGSRKRYTFPKNIKADTYKFKIEASSGLFDIMGYAIHGIEVTGLVKQSSTP